MSTDKFQRWQEEAPHIKNVIRPIPMRTLEAIIGRLQHGTGTMPAGDHFVKNHRTTSFD